MMPRPFRFALPLVSALLAADTTWAAVIGVVAPQQGPYASLGAQILAGARAAAGEADQIIAVNETCEQGNGTDVADRLMAANVAVAIGFLCVETAAEALPRLKMDAIPAISVSVRSKILMEDAERYQWPFFRLAPVDGMEAKKIAEVILSRWQNRPIALVDDGTIYGRELLSAVRQQIEAGGIKPVFTDTFRPGQEQQLALVRRLVTAGASHVLVGGDRNDVATMARDAAHDGASLTFVGGDVMRAADRPVPLTDGTLAVALPPYADLPAANEASARLRSQGIEPEGYVLPAYAAVQIAKAALAKSPQPPAEALKNLAAETVIGRIRFGEDRELAENPFRLQEWRNNAFHLVEPESE